MSGVGPLPARRASIESIKRSVALDFGVPIRWFAERRRTADIVRARQVAMSLAYRFTPLSYAGIGRRFGGLDHSTVLHSRRLIERLRRQDREFDARIRALEADLCPPPPPGPEVQYALFLGPLFDAPFPSSTGHGARQQEFAA